MHSELPTDLTPLLPPHLVEEVLELLNSQEEFMRRAKQSGAAVRALQTQYDSLEAVWDDLTLETLMERLETKKEASEKMRTDLNRSFESVIERRMKRQQQELDESEEDLQNASGRLKRREESWKTEFKTKRNGLLKSLHTLRDGLNELRNNGELTIIKQRTSYEKQNTNWEGTVTLGSRSNDDLLELEKTLTELQENLTRRKEDLQRRNQALPLLKQQSEETLIISQEKAAALNVKSKTLKTLKAQRSGR